MMDLDEQLRALSRDLDGAVGDRASRPVPESRRDHRSTVGVSALAVGVVVVLTVALGSMRTTELDLSTVTDPTSTAVAPATTTATSFADPPVVDASPLRLGLDVPGLEATAAVERCVVDGPQSWVCPYAAPPAAALGFWEQRFRADPDDLNGRSLVIWNVPVHPGTADPVADGILAIDGPGDVVAVVQPASDDRLTYIAWKVPDGSAVWVRISDVSRDEAIALVGELRPRADRGFDLPEGTGLVPVADWLDHHLDPPSSITYRGSGASVQVTVYSGNREDFEALASQLGSPTTPFGRVTVRGRPAYVSGGPLGSGEEAPANLTGDRTVIWFEPARGAVVVAGVTNGVDPSVVPVDVLDHLVELDDAAFASVAASTPAERP